MSVARHKCTTFHPHHGVYADSRFHVLLAVGTEWMNHAYRWYISGLVKIGLNTVKVQRGKV